MKGLIKKIAVAAVITASLAPLASFAQPQLPLTTPISSYGGLINFLGRIANMIFGILVAVTVFFMLRAAWMYLNAKDLDKAKDQILYAAVAIAVGLLAKGLPLLVDSIIGTNILG